MTNEAFAAASGAQPKWVENSERLLGRRVPRTQQGARWLGLVREATDSLASSLASAATWATALVGEPGAMTYTPLTPERRVVLMETSGGLQLSWDAGKLELAAQLRWSAARHLVPRQRGRPRHEPSLAGGAGRSAALGLDLSRLRVNLHRTPEQRLQRLDDDLAFIRAARASLARMHA